MALNPPSSYALAAATPGPAQIPAGRRATVWLVRAIRLAAVVALVACAVVLWKGLLANEGRGGCGPGFDCEQVLGSRWSLWFGIPVVLPGAALYLVMLVTTRLVAARMTPPARRFGWLALGALSATAALAGAWFVFLQVWKLGSVCPYCMTVHACGLLIAILCATAALGRRSERPRKDPRWQAVVAGVAPVILLGALALGQLRSRPASLFDLTRGHIDLAGADVPVLGSRRAPHVLVVMSDYTCSHCRATSPVIDEVLRRYGDQVAVVELPVPLNSRCNPAVTHTAESSADACDLAQVALAVWRLKPEQFARMHAWLFEPRKPRTAAEARTFAAGLVGGAGALERAERDPWVGETIRRDGEMYRQLRMGKIPKIIFPDSVHDGEVLDRETFFTAIEKAFGIKPVTPGRS